MKKSRRILIVDDNVEIHRDIKTILLPQRHVDAGTRALEEELFGEVQFVEKAENANIDYLMDDAYQGAEAIEMVRTAAESGSPYSLIFMDVRMPPGLDGIQTIKKIWQDYPFIEMVICTAYSDYSWDEIIETLGTTDKLMLVKKPFDPVAIQQMAMTLTTKWELQQKSLKYMEDLEEEVKLRTRQLDHLIMKLEHTKNRALSDAEAKGHLLANMSHEIRTPMSDVVGMSDLLLQTDLTEEQRELAETVSFGAETMMHVVDNILDISQIEAGRLEIESRPFGVNHIVRSISNLLRTRAGGDQPAFDVEIDPDIPALLIGDPTRISQALLNFGSNAVRHTPDGRITLTAELLEKRDADGTYLIRFAVIDTGSGIPMEKQEQLFRDSRQDAEKSSNGERKKSGLGLIISKHLAEAMGGEVGFTSELGSGSTFWFTVECKEHAGKDRSEPGIDAEVPGELSGTKVLVAEDNPVNQKVIKKMLQKFGIEPDMVNNGKDAVDLASKQRYDLVLMDLQMPELGGIEATRLIRQKNDGAGDALRIIALTASAIPEDRMLSLDSGMDGYLKKPVTLNDLGTVLRSFGRVATG